MDRDLTQEEIDLITRVYDSNTKLVKIGNRLAIYLFNKYPSLDEFIKVQKDYVIENPITTGLPDRTFKEFLEYVIVINTKLFDESNV